jgi:hypothetical protein
MNISGTTKYCVVNLFGISPVRSHEATPVHYPLSCSGRAWSLSEIEFDERKINNLRKCSGTQVIDSSFENSYLRQTPCPARFLTRDIYSFPQPGARDRRTL